METVVTEGHGRRNFGGLHYPPAVLCILTNSNEATSPEKSLRMATGAFLALVVDLSLSKEQQSWAGAVNVGLTVGRIFLWVIDVFLETIAGSCYRSLRPGRLVD